MRGLSLLLWTLLCMSSPLLAQQPKRPDNAAQFLHEQKDLWLSPLKIRRGDVKWLAPLGAGAALLLATDWSVSDAARRSQDLRPASRVVSRVGGSIPMMAVSGSMWALGKVTHNDKAAGTGRLAVEAVLHTEILVGGLKVLTNRERPNKPLGHGEFWDGGHSFPSGHAATTFAFATVVSHEYRNKPLVAIGAYGLATAVSLSRVGGLNHFPSDVLIGATIGHLIGRYVIHHH